MPSQIAAQMYTLRDHCKTNDDLARTCQQVRDMGFEAIQGSAGAFGSITAEDLKKILDDTGLKCIATHKGMDALRDVDRMVDYHQTIGCELTALGSFHGKTREEWLAFGKELDDIAKRSAERGLRVGYHNHSHEFAPFALPDRPAEIDPDEAPLPLLLRETDDLWFELDTYWVTAGGGDPAQWIRRCNNRIPAIHVKDMTVGQDRQQKMCEVGRGNLNWTRILEASKHAGVDWYIIERDSGDVDPFESLRISFQQLKEMGVR